MLGYQGKPEVLIHNIYYITYLPYQNGLPLVITLHLF